MSHRAVCSKCGEMILSLGHKCNMTLKTFIKKLFRKERYVDLQRIQELKDTGITPVFDDSTYRILNKEEEE